MKDYVINDKLAYFKADVNKNYYRSLSSKELPEDTIENWLKLPNGFYYSFKENIPKSYFPSNYMIILKWSIGGDCVLLGFGLPKGSISYRTGTLKSDSGWKIIAIQ